MFILSEEYFYKNIIKFNIDEIQETIVYKDKYYNSFWIPKSNGKRKISGIDQNSDLFLMQENILHNFLAKVQLPLCAKGFVKHNSYINYLQEHINKKFYMRMDIKNFFDTITIQQIEESLSEFIKTPKVLNYLVELCTLNDKLPQGAVTSPDVSNIIFRRIDQRITKYCQKFDINYTRYADDLLFSSNKLNFKEEKWFYKKVKYILKENGFESNYSKRHMESKKMCLGGYVIEKDIHLSRKKLKVLNTILYYFKDKSNSNKYVIDSTILKRDYIDEINKMQIKDGRNSKKIFSNKMELINYLCGYRSFLISIVKNNDNSKKSLIKKIMQIEILIKALE